MSKGQKPRQATLPARYLGSMMLIEATRQAHDPERYSRTKQSKSWYAARAVFQKLVTDAELGEPEKKFLKWLLSNLLVNRDIRPTFHAPPMAVPANRPKNQDVHKAAALFVAFSKHNREKISEAQDTAKKLYRFSTEQMRRAWLDHKEYANGIVAEIYGDGTDKTPIYGPNDFLDALKRDAPRLLEMRRK